MRTTGRVQADDDLRRLASEPRGAAGVRAHDDAWACSADNRRAAFLALAHELDAHATAEERHLYVPLLLDDAGLSVSRHALADHHKAEKLVEQLRGVDPATDHFVDLAKELSTRSAITSTRKSTARSSSPESCSRSRSRRCSP